MQNVVLITGASSGIGKSIGEYLAKLNYKVYGTSRNPKQSELNGVHFLKLDVTDLESIQTAIGTIISKEKKIDFLINNAGVGITGPLEEIPEEEQKKIFDTNYFGPLRVINTVLPYMRARQAGFIINITSIAGHMGLPFRGFYSASKGALELTTEAYRMELKAFGIKMTNVAPGDFATNIAAGRYHAPIKEDSPYKEVYERSLKLMDAHVDEGKDPNLMARSIYSIMQKSNPKIHYKVGDFTQKISVFLKHILPDKVFENLLLKHYKL
ncbi:SDR family oxidoreductase [Psychroflexus gondwanensis]|jgi:NAD(P)-dependent dehydrogenase (short-subunit alcohol dehydrogenase family)|uniref:SDR family oxidoreductase n=1 Tax=Psychroflexus gondwanensis TaxID=251 RepID=UPI0011BD81BD|nr:SDR family oxidoreductase [Psychroflexus gondwanensis]TXE20889.1 SDR family oxidoreductase [Psychroflexus gondwanensis]